MTTRDRPRHPQADDHSPVEQLPDPVREPDMQQSEQIFRFRMLLGIHYAGRDDVLVSGGGYLQDDADNEAERLAPDCMVVFGVDPAAVLARNGYVIGEVGKPPDLVLEVGTRSKGRQDYTVKRDAYLDHGVPEYWRFDPTGGRYHVSALAGDVLVDGEYRPMEIAHEPDGLIWGHSEVLGLDLCWDVGDLRFRDPVSREFLLMPEEEQAGRREAERRALLAERERDEQAAGRREAEAEIRQLRERLEELERGR